MGYEAKHCRACAGKAPFPPGESRLTHAFSTTLIASEGIHALCGLLDGAAVLPTSGSRVAPGQPVSSSVAEPIKLTTDHLVMPLPPADVKPAAGRHASLTGKTPTGLDFGISAAGFGLHAGKTSASDSLEITYSNGASIKATGATLVREAWDEFQTHGGFARLLDDDQE